MFETQCTTRKWPAANPKTLSVQFDTKENVRLERHRNGPTPASAKLSFISSSAQNANCLSGRDQQLGRYLGEIQA
ncbi:hypothetical protein KIN20_027568 [Parelaphostrongylus tenuis]|uniref:Uncharacterized protein n=1 Tax=Parelaphostrongylus tenuis TaxID=148309 RepID=A0AAD5WE18_PARTN|nr:hypothetical protein KIN20_027568 [Parelaphostrongylus tenuis]